MILLDEKRNEARRRLKVKKGKRPEKSKRSKSEIGENLFDEKKLIDEERLSSWLLSGL